MGGEVFDKAGAEGVLVLRLAGLALVLGVGGFAFGLRILGPQQSRIDVELAAVIEADDATAARLLLGGEAVLAVVGVAARA
jgi:hypothetical protein